MKTDKPAVRAVQAHDGEPPIEIDSANDLSLSVRSPVSKTRVSISPERLIESHSRPSKTGQSCLAPRAMKASISASRVTIIGESLPYVPARSSF